MWVSVTIILLVPAVVVTMHILAPHDLQAPQGHFTQLHVIASQALESSAREVV
jgi:hypothetical protein